jgi:hypothetical protein
LCSYIKTAPPEAHVLFIDVIRKTIAEITKPVCATQRFIVYWMKSIGNDNAALLKMLELAATIQCHA